MNFIEIIKTTSKDLYAYVAQSKYSTELMAFGVGFFLGALIF